jgi:hypothetical protein
MNCRARRYKRCKGKEPKVPTARPTQADHPRIEYKNQKPSAACIGTPTAVRNTIILFDCYQNLLTTVEKVQAASDV